MNFKVLLALAPVFLSSCQYNQAPIESPAQTKIVGGTEATSADPGYQSVVLLQIFKEVHDGSADSLLPTEMCTGVLIDRDIVLTAAHCLVVSKKESGAWPTTVRGVVHFPQSPQTHIEFKKLLAHENYTYAETVTEQGVTIVTGQNDVGIILLKERAPREALAAEIAPEVPHAPFVVRSYGFGRTSFPNAKKLEQGNVYEDDTNHFTVRPLRYADLVADLDLPTGRLRFDQKNGKGICPGDSGGPNFLFDHDKTYVLALNSHLSEISDGLDDFCRSLGYSALVPPHRDWLNEAIVKIRKKTYQPQ